MALYAVCPLFLAVFVGRFADRVGPRVPMLIGIGGVVRGSPAASDLSGRRDAVPLGAHARIHVPFFLHHRAGHHGRNRRRRKPFPQLRADRHGLFRRGLHRPVSGRSHDRPFRPPCRPFSCSPRFRFRRCCCSLSSRVFCRERANTRAARSTEVRSSCCACGACAIRLSRAGFFLRRGTSSSSISPCTATRSDFPRPRSEPCSVFSRSRLSRCAS